MTTTETPIGLADIAAISSTEEGRATALALYNKLPRWVEITDDPATWPPENVAVLIWAQKVQIAYYENSQWWTPLSPYLMRNKKIGWARSRQRKSQRVFMWRPI